MDNKENTVLQYWIQNTPYLTGARGIRNPQSHPSAVDAQLIMPNDKEYKVLIKIEDDWPFRTGNLTFEFIYALTWNDKPKPNKWMPIHTLLDKVTVLQWGTFMNEMYDIILKGLYKNKKLTTIIPLWGERLRQDFDSLQQTLCKVRRISRYPLEDYFDTAFFTLSMQSDIVQKAIVRKEDLT